MALTNKQKDQATTIAGGAIAGGLAGRHFAKPKPAETKPAETKPAETKPAETKPINVKPKKLTTKEKLANSESEEAKLRKLVTSSKTKLDDVEAQQEKLKTLRHAELDASGAKETFLSKVIPGYHKFIDESKEIQSSISAGLGAKLLITELRKRK